MVTAALVAMGGFYWVSRRYDTRQRAALEQFVSVHLREISLGPFPMHV